MSVLVVEQPNYVPWLGYFDLIDRADVWVWYDDVQYTKRDWRNRNRVAGDGDPIWLTIPVRSREHRDQQIADVEIDRGQPWARKHLATLRHLYGKSPFFDPVFGLVRGCLENAPETLADLTIGLNEDLCALLGIAADFRRSSEMTEIEGTKAERILSVCRQIEPAVYLSGPAARDYLTPESFESRSIALEYISYTYEGYWRGGQPERVDLSILDPLFWVGPAATRELIRGRGPGPDPEGDR